MQNSLKIVNLKNKAKAEKKQKHCISNINYANLKYANQHENNECFSVVLTVNEMISTAVFTNSICKMRNVFVS